MKAVMILNMHIWHLGSESIALEVDLNVCTSIVGSESWYLIHDVLYVIEQVSYVPKRLLLLLCIIKA